MPFWEAIINSGQASAPEMGLWLSRKTGDNLGGALTFGGAHSSYYSGDIEYLDLAGKESTFWALDVSGASGL